MKSMKKPKSTNASMKIIVLGLDEKVCRSPSTVYVRGIR